MTQRCWPEWVIGGMGAKPPSQPSLPIAALSHLPSTTHPRTHGPRPSALIPPQPMRPMTTPTPGRTHPAPWALALLLAACLLPAQVAHAARLALVIGNDQYRQVAGLKNARNDARLMAATLSAAGFEVVGGVRTDLDRNGLWRALEQFKARVRKGDEVVFYFAGHGVQVEANQLLLPVDIANDSEDQVARDAVPLHQVQRQLADAQFALLVIDACRDNPFPPKPGSTRSIGGTRGLAPPAQALDGSVVLLAAAAGQKALDSVPGVTTGNGLFTHELVKALKTPGQGVLAAVRQTRAQVEAQARRVNHAQRPSYVDEMSGEFVLFPAAASGTTATSTAPAVQPATPAPEPAPVTPSLQPGQVVKDCSECPELVVIAAGEFTMGSPVSEPERDSDEGPQRRVKVASFLAARYEVTFEQWDACVAAGGCSHKPEDRGWGRGQRPVINVSWEDAQQYVKWLSGKAGKGYRLLSEAEWEYVARAGTSTPFWTGQTISVAQANFDGNYTYNGSAKGEYRQKTVPVGSFGANAFGLYDTSGNVWEWVQDVLHENYSGAPSDGSAWMSGGDQTRRVLRGGSWINYPQDLRSAFRFSISPDNRFYGTGFRIARTY